MKQIKAKILLNQIGFDITKEMNDAISYFRRHFVTLSVDYQLVNITGYKSELGNTTFGTRQMILTGAKELVEEYIDEEYDIVYLFANTLKEFGSNIPSDSTQGYLSNGKTVFVNINAGDDWDDQPGNLALWIQHETMHALGIIATKAGYPVVDCMDVMTVNGVQERYYLNDQPDNVNSNFINMWERLYPWLISKDVINLNVVIKRITDNGHETTGILTYGNFKCNTLELPWKGNQHNISCIPKGTYSCVVHPFHDKQMYEVLNVPNRTGIFIHPANYVTQLLGCIALGVNPADINHDGLMDVTNSGNTVSSFMDLFKGKQFTLVIE